MVIQVELLLQLQHKLIQLQLVVEELVQLYLERLVVVVQFQLFQQ
tara:strand:+ start:127 stop:261 length:135 start_codon:yes stop_codon:yes gene_type:complete